VKPEEFRQREIELHGWPVRLISYKLGGKYVVEAENSAGARLAQFAADTLEHAESQAISKAGHLLSKTREHQP
jgi:hypothetical protein